MSGASRAAPRHGNTAKGPAAGVTLAETLVALVLGFALLHLALSAVERARTAHVTLLSRADALLSFRLTATVLRSELHVGVEGRDWRLVGDTLSLRAFRGTALVCPGGDEPDVLLVSYSGYRAPDPAKDSLLVIRADGRAHVTALLATAVGAPYCHGAPLERPLLLRTAEPVPGPVLVRVFEHGRYSVAGAALRYTRGSSGRQPLTPEVWGPESRLEGTGTRVGARLTDTDGRRWDLFLAHRGGS